MIDTRALKEGLCDTFCGDIVVKTLPAGVAVTTTFRDSADDPIACFIERDADGWYMADDGHFLSDTVARGIDIHDGPRKDFLDRVLTPAGAWCDLQYFQIRTRAKSLAPPPSEIIQFITALVRARDVAFWSRERVRNTFNDDAYRALVERFAARADVRRAEPVDRSMQEFPADAILRAPVGADSVLPTTAVFFVQGLEGLNEALMLWMEVRERRRSDVKVAALLEDGTVSLSSAKARRAVNRIDGIAVFRGDEKAAIDRIEQIGSLAAAE